MTKDFADGTIKAEELKEERQKRMKSEGINKPTTVKKRPAAAEPMIIDVQDDIAAAPYTGVADREEACQGRGSGGRSAV